MDEFCFSSDKPEGPIFSSSNVLTFVFDSDGSVTRRGYFISVSAGINLLPPATKLGQGYVFTGVCSSVHRGGSASVHAGIPHPLSRRPTPPEQTPPGADPPGSRHPWSRHPLPPGSRPPGSRHLPTPMQSILGVKANARAVRILLECNLVNI